MLSTRNTIIAVAIVATLVAGVLIGRSAQSTPTADVSGPVELAGATTVAIVAPDSKVPPLPDLRRPARDDGDVRETTPDVQPDPRPDIDENPPPDPRPDPRPEPDPEPEPDPDDGPSFFID